ncbi:hypothetical protein HRbin29_02209 [bacterium HR29]|jgi:uncharacterized protein YdhG (YjbR/CyaY superfamily)|nr:hypothetical protein HRbin29_02209 [bacterium HR29]
MAKRGVDEGFSEAEREAMRERARELRARRGPKRDPDEEVRERIAQLPEPDRTLALRIHEIVREEAPALTPRLWYGMPAYAKAGSVLCFLQPASKFGTRYATFGFTDAARLDEGSWWPVSFALTALEPETEETIRRLLRKALG